MKKKTETFNFNFTREEVGLLISACSREVHTSEEWRERLNKENPSSYVQFQDRLYAKKIDILEGIIVELKKTEEV